MRARSDTIRHGAQSHRSASGAVRYSRRMGFMDKMKEQANSLAVQVNDTVSKGQQSFEEGQARKQADALLRDLGALVYLRYAGRGAANSDAEIARITAALEAHEAKGEAINLEVRSGTMPPPAPPAPPADPAGE